MTDRITDIIYDNGDICIEVLTDFDVILLGFINEIRVMDSKTRNFEDGKKHKVLIKTGGMTKEVAHKKHKEIVEGLKVAA